jgi:hypothetical protein
MDLSDRIRVEAIRPAVVSEDDIAEAMAGLVGCANSARLSPGLRGQGTGQTRA